MARRQTTAMIGIDGRYRLPYARRISGLLNAAALQRRPAKRFTGRRYWICVVGESVDQERARVRRQSPMPARAHPTSANVPGSGTPVNGWLNSTLSIAKSKVVPPNPGPL